jgi:hypothetical protein
MLTPRPAEYMPVEVSRILPQFGAIRLVGAAESGEFDFAPLGA